MLFKLFRSPPRPTAPSSRRASPPLPGAHTDWTTLRCPPKQADQQLSALATSWLEALPPHERPTVLCECFARIANRLALVWPDAELTARYFDSLIIDRRGGRKGFPPEVMAELIRLRAHRTQSERTAKPPVALQMKVIDFDPS